MPEFLANRHARIMTVVLLAQAAAFYAIALRSETTPPAPPLDMFPGYVGEWRMSRNKTLDKETLEILKADYILSRDYVNHDGTAGANLFVAFFKTQRTGQAPHSPKNCLPGSGWAASVAGFTAVPIAGSTDPITVNHYIVSRGGEKSVVLYWYQSPRRVVASEYKAKFWLVADAIRYRRSDTSLVRVVVPVRDGDDAAATKTAVAFVQALYPELRRYLP